MEPYYQDDAVTIYNADCRDVLPMLDKVDLVLTDPPYGVDATYGPAYDDSRDTYWQWFLPCLAQVRESTNLLVFTHRVTALKKIRDWDWVGVWNKPFSAGTRLGNSQILPHWEPIFFYGIYKVGVLSNYVSDVFTFNLTGNGLINGRGRAGWQARQTDHIKHPTPKPTDLFKLLTARLTLPDHIILDPFMGSGTTLRAAKDLGRKAIGIEIEERYCEIAAQRMSQSVLAFDAI